MKYINKDQKGGKLGGREGILLYVNFNLTKNILPNSVGHELRRLFYG